MKKDMFLLIAALCFVSWATASNLTFEKVGDFGIVHPGAIVTIDINNDGFPALLYMERSADKRSIYIENNKGVLTPHHYAANVGIKDFGLPYRENPGMVVADVNHDGKQDVILSGGWPPTLEVYLNNGKGNFQKDASQVNLQGARDWENSDYLAVGDYDNDGWDDLFVLGMTYDKELAKEFMKLSVYRNNNGVFDKPDQSLIGCRSGSIAVGDISGDGHLDVFYTGYGCGYETHLYYGNGAGVWRAEMNIPFDQAIKGDVAILDFDNDGALDLIEQGREHGGTTIYRNNGDGTFDKKLNTETGLPAREALYIDYGDFNADGKVDVIGADWLIADNGGATAIFLNNGNLTFSKVDAVEEARGSVFAWDYDKDNQSDYIVWYYSDLLQSYNAPIVHNITKTTPSDIGKLVEDLNEDSKFIHDGCLFIRHEGKLYNILGLSIE